MPNQSTVTLSGKGAWLPCVALVIACAGLLPASAQSTSPPAPSPAIGVPAPPDVAPIAPDVPRISQQSLLARATKPADKRVILDVRTPAEFAAGHVPGAINIPHDQLPKRVIELDALRDREIVVYCRTGRRSNTALHTLKAAGFAKLAHLEGDFVAWQSAGHPIEKVDPVKQPSSERPVTPGESDKP
jgi:phage shock protein E